MANGNQSHVNRKRLITPISVLAAYITINFLMTPGNEILSFPFHHDDYSELSYTFSSIHYARLPVFRPVSTYLYAVFSSLGINSFYLIQNGLTVGYVALSLSLVGAIFRLRENSAIAAFTAACFIFSFESVPEYYKYTGMMPDLLSGVLGVASAIFLVVGFRASRQATLKLAGGCVLFVLSLMSHEDFFAMLLALCAFYAVFPDTKAQSARRRAVATFSVLLTLSGGYFAYVKFIGGGPVVGAVSGPYRGDYSLASMAHVMWEYLTMSRLTVYALAVQIVSLLVNGVLRLCKWRYLFLLQGIVFTLILPYTTLPNHVFRFYCFDWIPFQAAPMLLASELTKKPAAAGPRIAAISVLTAMAGAAIFVTQPVRSSVIGWYRSNADINRRMVRTLVDHKSLLNSFQTVGVVGVPLFCPWLLNDGTFLRTRYGLTCHWIVFVPAESEFYKLTKSRFAQDAVGAFVNGAVEIRKSDTLTTPYSLPVVIYGPTGAGALVYDRARPGSVSSSSPDIPLRSSIDASPNPVPPGKGSGTTTISWQTGDGAVGEVYVVVPGGEEKLFARGEKGSSEAPWIREGSTEFRLYEGTNHSIVLARVVVTRAAQTPSGSPY